jgi:PAS domain S-box-containing protein
MTATSPRMKPHRFGQDAAELYRLLVDQVQDYAIFALDTDGHILSWNAGAERLKGYTESEIIGRHFSIFYPPEDIAAQKPARELELAIATGKAEDEGWRLRKDGTKFWASVLITALRDDNHALVGFAKVTRDLTERRRVEEELRASEERFRLLVDNVRDTAIYMLDPSGMVTTWNAGAERLKGYSADQIIGKHFSVFYPPEDAATPERELAIALSTGSYEDEGWRVRSDGSRFMANVVITPIVLPTGKLIGFAKVTRDLTERRAALDRAVAAARRIAAEEAAREAAERRAIELRELAEQLGAQAAELERQSLEAARANRAKSEFLAAMSHELRTPLNAIGGYAQLMEMGIGGPVSDEQRTHLERIQRSQQHLLGIINDILNFSRIEAGQLQYNIGPVALQDVLDAGAAMVVPQVREKQLRVKISACGPDLVATADRAKVEQILLNLLSNAVKFTPPGGEIELTCTSQPNHILLSVHDTGIGIPAEQLEMIFAPFMQVGRSLASPKEGTGLGLAISRDLAQAMQGDLTVESREGKGSTFTLTLPRAL